jgi:choline kinase
MGDHIFQPETAAALLRQPLREDEVILAVDYDVDRIFDLDDATKVACDGGHITAIGKTIENYEAIDTGMFLCSPIVFSCLRSALKNGNCSLSDAMRVLIRNRKLRSFDIGDGLWQDVDTPQAFSHAEFLAEQHIQFLPEAVLV